VPMLASNFGLAAGAGLLGPLVLVPTATIINTMAYAIHVARRHRLLVFGAGLASFAVPFALELVGVVPPSYGFGTEGMTILTRGLELSATPTIVALAGLQVLSLVLAALVLGVIRDNIDASERRTYTYAWHLREFVPESLRRDTDPIGRGE
jgi:hypothetical protein